MNQLMAKGFPDVARISIDSRSPPMDSDETGELDRADLPEVPEDIDVGLAGQVLRISGEHGGQPDTAAGGSQRGERRRGPVGPGPARLGD